MTLHFVLLILNYDLRRVSMIHLLEKFPKAQIHRGPLENNAALGLTPKPSRETGQSKGFGIRKVCISKVLYILWHGKALKLWKSWFLQYSLESDVTQSTL